MSDITTFIANRIEAAYLGHGMKSDRAERHALTAADSLVAAGALQGTALAIRQDREALVDRVHQHYVSKGVTFHGARIWAQTAVDTLFSLGSSADGALTVQPGKLLDLRKPRRRAEKGLAAAEAEAARAARGEIAIGV